MLKPMAAQATRPLWWVVAANPVSPGLRRNVCFRFVLREDASPGPILILQTQFPLRARGAAAASRAWLNSP
jgi:hypothetical protein